jgi:hypothetical protein
MGELIPSQSSDPFSHMRLFKTLDTLTFLSVVGILTAVPTRASTLVSGSGTFNFDPTAWASVAGGANVPGFEALKLNEVFDQPAAAARTGNQILTDEVVTAPSPTGIQFNLNGPTVNNLALRYSKPTDFDFTPGNLTAHTGVIGLGGVTRWDVNPLLGGGSLAFGDFTLSYDASRSLVGGSGWNLKANIAPAGVAFDLLNVQTSFAGNTLTISGDLGLSFEVANFLLSTPSDQGKDMGNFVFTGVAVPEPSAYGWVAAIACAGLAGVRRAKRGSGVSSRVA